jgi:predicted molibdopterin-dependent oxidoreductase YjgC
LSAKPAPGSDNVTRLARRGPAITVYLDGRPVRAYPGETVASVLLAEGLRAFRETAKRGEPRGVFCGIGVCYECLVIVDGAPNVRACVTIVLPGMTIETGTSSEPRADLR